MLKFCFSCKSIIIATGLALNCYFFADPVTDFQISTERYTVRPGVNQDIIVTYRVDSVAQEPMESAQLELSISTTPPRGLLTRDTFELAIIDSDSKDYVTMLILWMFVPIT